MNINRQEQAIIEVSQKISGRAIIAGKYSKRVNRGMLLWNALTEKLSYVQTDATTPNIVGPRMLGVLVSVLAAVV